MPDGHAVAVVADDDRTRRAQEAGHDAWWVYVSEVLGHLRLPHQPLSVAQAANPPDAVRVLVFTTTPRLDPATSAQLAAWVHSGGSLIVVGDPGDLAELAGVQCGDTVDQGHVRLAKSPVWSSVPDVCVHAVGGVRLGGGNDVEVLARWEPSASGEPESAVTLRRHGAGVVLASGVDLWQSIVRIQQGYRVAVDGKPAADGTAPIDDNVLKCEDGIALSFERDRAMPPGQPQLTTPFNHSFPPRSAVPMFHRPHADIWRSLFLQCVWWAAEQADAAVPWLYYWPAGVPAVAHMSHDADGNADDDAEAALDAFAEADVRVTWCQIFPGGYSPATIAAITAAGHEHALHYNAMGDADTAQWGWQQMRAQHAWAQAVTGTEAIVSNKNHYTRWEGWTEFYQWCEHLGIQIDQSRGPSKLGSVGFPFGTSHLSFPIADAADGNRLLDVLNLPLHTQDLAWAGHESIRDVILDGALEQHGVAHFLFHGPHLRRHPPTRKACLALAAEARRRGLPWWTSAEINNWERRRRSVQLAVQPNDGGWTVEASAVYPIDDASVLLTLPGVGETTRPTVRGAESSAGVVSRHGRHFVELEVNIAAGRNRWYVTL